MSTKAQRDLGIGRRRRPTKPKAAPVRSNASTFLAECNMYTTLAAQEKEKRKCAAQVNAYLSLRLSLKAMKQPEVKTLPPDANTKAQRDVCSAQWRLEQEATARLLKQNAVLLERLCSPISGERKVNVPQAAVVGDQAKEALGFCMGCFLSTCSCESAGKTILLSHMSEDQPRRHKRSSRSLSPGARRASDSDSD